MTVIQSDIPLACVIVVSCVTEHCVDCGCSNKNFKVNDCIAKTVYYLSIANRTGFISKLADSSPIPANPT